MLKKFLYSLGYHFGHGLRKAFKNEIDLFIKEKSFHLPSRHEYNQKFLSYDFFKDEISNTFICKDRLSNLSYALEKSLEKGNKNLFLEFGIFHGRTTNFISDKIKSHDITLSAFDSFEGLSEDRIGTEDIKGTFKNADFKNLNLNNNVNVIHGNIYDTLPKFLLNTKEKIDFIHIDTDTYETSKFILSKVKNKLKKDSIIVFDDFHNFPGWQQGEYKSLIEVFERKDYEYLSFSYSNQASIIIN